MVITKDVPRWETRPLDCWAKAKELRRDSYAAIEEAGKTGKLIIGYFGEALRPLLRGFEHECLVTEAYSAHVATFDDLAKECHEKLDNLGFMPDLCAYARLYWGSMLLDKSPWGSFPKVNILIQDVGGCTVHNKLPQYISENLGIPVYLTDGPQGNRRCYSDPEDFALGKEIYVNYRIDQLHELIPWLEEKSGQRFDDERFLESLRYHRDIEIHFAKVIFLNQTIPAPLDTKSLYALVAPRIQLGGTKEAADFYHTLLDEVKWRVENQIAQLATERCRLSEDNVPPWYAMRILRYVNDWGATIIVCPYLMGIGGMDSDGEHYLVPKTFEEEGNPLRTREDGLRALCEERGRGGGVQQTVQRMKSLMRDWKCDGLILRNNQGCRGRIGLQEYNYVLSQSGIPCMTYEANQGDKRSFNEPLVMSKMEAFLEGTMGLNRLVS